MSTQDDDFEVSATIKASEFKAKCLKLMDEISANGGEIVITENGLPVSRLVPYRDKPDSLLLNSNIDGTRPRKNAVGRSTARPQAQQSRIG